MNEKIFNRIELYKQVWSKPMIHLAKEYGLSDNGLRKICKKLGVPLPKSGHWSKIQFGKKVEQIPLPSDRSYPETYESKPQSSDSSSNSLEQKKNVEVDPELERIIDFEKNAKNKIKVPKAIDRLHPRVNHTRNSLRGERIDYKGLITPKIDCLDINVTPRSLNRALRIFHTIISAFSDRGIKFTFKSEVGKRHSCFSVWGEDIF